ncbi:MULTISPECIES: hypothetical protein [Rhodococcus]|jgi:hypothetical protein|uniref:hypothetical protein n=1 Tax=Rhodococcus TaxID=1827 RepID=UPI0002E626B8|nr:MULTISPECIES: hypothetical protein [Rhodococcus]QQZ19454.1 hypothetical protein GO592_37075 [Rhodococcus sp. 21391]
MKQVLKAVLVCVVVGAAVLVVWVVVVRRLVFSSGWGGAGVGRLGALPRCGP